MAPAKLVRWVLDRPYSRERAGDRLRLYLPQDLARCERDRLVESLRLRALAEQADHVDTRELRIRQVAGRFFLDVFAGVYLEDDLGDLATRTWPQISRASLLPDLVLVALAAREVHRVTGADLEAALLFLLCDAPCGQAFVMSFSTDSGLRFWAYDPFLPAKDLSREYVAFRRLYVSRTRPKRPERHTLELIRFVQKLRPHPGRHAANAPWPEVLRQWNAAHPVRVGARGPYAEDDGGASISAAYRQALVRRRELGQL